MRDYISEYDLPSKAEHVLKRLEKVISGLVKNPGRGTFPKELLALGIRDYRQVFFNTLPGDLP